MLGSRCFTHKVALVPIDLRADDLADLAVLDPLQHLEVSASGFCAGCVPATSASFFWAARSAVAMIERTPTGSTGHRVFSD